MLVIQITHVVSDEAPAGLQANIHTYKQCLLEHIDGSGEEHAATEWTAVVWGATYVYLQLALLFELVVWTKMAKVM